MYTKIFAHRGASMYAPENTMSAFHLAYELGAEGIETDVHLTKDQIPVLIHDETIDRTTDGSGYIKDYTFNQLKNLNAGLWFSHQYDGAQIISLEEFLIWSKPKPLYLNIELKNNKIEYNHLETIVYEMLQYYQLLDRTIISTFNVKSLRLMKQYHLKVQSALLTSRRPKNLIQKAISLGVNSIHIKYSSLRTTLVKHAHRENISIRVYTVNKPIQMMRCFAQRCDGLFTDVPDRGIKYRNLLQK